MKAISVLGSTGSIGTQTLEIVEAFPDRFQVVALTANRNLDLLLEQILRHRPEMVALADQESITPTPPNTSSAPQSSTATTSSALTPAESLAAHPSAA
jgi:1-deoxy-D-xylulose 5-phosphate reductoisomerase